ncbi:MAG: class I SAM-dependent methyltransferase [Actinomycetota bacterium]|nr:class I SAM-dependent methyltransferase [Actinomycetota bacterium]MDQ3910195.1 class I SAM-dependent methyltransferase [Actinomycetota bacterium]
MSNGIDRPKRSQSSDNLQNVYNAKSNQEAAELYDSWAQEYEQAVSSWGYTTPAVSAGLFGRYVEPKDGAVLDAGAGTGITGEILALLGYKEIAGIDVSQDMLELARTKGVYKELHQMELGSELNFPTDAFSAVVSTGVFAAGHAPPGSFEELIRVTRAGGHIVFSVRTDAYEEGGFKKEQEKLEGEGKWRLLEVSEAFSHLRFEDPELKVKVFAYQVL